MVELLGAEAAYTSTGGARGNGRASLVFTYVCPYPDCRSYALHQWGHVHAAKTSYIRGSQHSRATSENTNIVVSLCSACNREDVFVNDHLVFPASSEAPQPSADMPTEVLGDYEEARAILGSSPRGAAALLRLVVQKMLPALGATESEINNGIKKLVAAGRISQSVQQALDTVRVIGNEAVHPGTMDLRDDVGTATALFKLINVIVEKAITEPKAIAEIYSTLPPGKLAGIEARDKDG